MALMPGWSGGWVLSLGVSVVLVAPQVRPVLKVLSVLLSLSGVLSVLAMLLLPVSLLLLSVLSGMSLLPVS